MAGEWRMRAACPNDLESLAAAHMELFPVDYDWEYFKQLCSPSGGIASVCAFAAPPSPGGVEELAGFVAWTTCALSSLELSDARLIAHMLGLPDELAAQTHAMYVLSVGVLPRFRRRGLASALLAAAEAAPSARHTAAAFLHVAAYNADAHKLYLRLGFRLINEHADFYNLNAARAPDPSRSLYGGYVFARRCERSAADLHAAALAGDECRLDLGWPGRPSSRSASAGAWEPWLESCLSLPSNLCSLPTSMLQRLGSACNAFGSDAAGASRRVSACDGGESGLRSPNAASATTSRRGGTPRSCFQFACLGSRRPRPGTPLPEADDSGGWGPQLLGSEHGRPPGSAAAKCGLARLPFCEEECAAASRFSAFRRFFRPTLLLRS